MPFPTLQASTDKQTIVQTVLDYLESQGLTIVESDTTRPWGAFFRIANPQADDFITKYFDGVAVPPAARQGERSPKILLVAPGHRLSWQHHDRRGEFWRAVSGQVGIYTSHTDAQPESLHTLNVGEVAHIPQGTRHRLVGLDNWGAVAEIWMHTDPSHPSDESDIYRLQDDYSR